MYMNGECNVINHCREPDMQERTSAYMRTCRNRLHLNNSCIEFDHEYLQRSQTVGNVCSS